MSFIEIRLPADQTEGSTHEMGTWLRGVGDQVRKDEPLLEVITDKVTVEIASPADGVLAEILKQPGEMLEKGDVLGRIQPAGQTEAAKPEVVRRPGGQAVTQPSAEPPSRPAVHPSELSPAVRRLIQQHNLEPSQITGSGAGGRITAQDVESHLAKQAARPRAPTAQSSAAEPPSRPAVQPVGRRAPHSPMRRRIAEHMVQSVRNAPHVTAVFEADLTRVIEHRNSIAGERPTLTAYFVRAAVAALEAVPEANSRWHDDGLELFTDCNIGIAVALPPPNGGLIVPVLHQAQHLDLAATAHRLEDLTRRARDGRLEPREVQGGTFTISNHGVSGSLLAAPIVIVQPQAAILGVGKLERRPRVMPSGAIEARSLVYVTLTIDHRVLDGFQANRFLNRWVEVIEGGQW